MNFCILQPNAVQMRIPLKESLARLDKTGLLNFCQCLINQIPHEYLSQAQTILDKLTSKSNDLPKVYDIFNVLHYEFKKWSVELIYFVKCLI